MTRRGIDVAAIAGEAGRRAVFSADGREYRWSDVIAAAAVRGDWEALRRQAAVPRPPVGREALNAWRRRRRLYSADETVRWLEHWCIDQLDLECHLGLRVRGAVSDLDRAAWIEATCTGEHRGIARELAARVALAPPGSGTAVGAAELERLDRDFERRKQEIEASPAVTELIGAHASEWIGVRCRRLTLEDLDAAREAVLCVQVDGLSLVDVAGVAGAELDEASSFLDELDSDWRALVAGAAVGELRGPVSTRDGHAVLELLDKSFAAGDPAVLARARAAAVDQAIARESARFTWHEQL